MEKVGASSKSDRIIIAKEVNLERLKNNPISFLKKMLKIFLIYKKVYNYLIRCGSLCH